ncbi:NAD(P)/FAD-dependent oxidoreductase [Paracoccus sp. DMF]|uniref:flavin-dependent monooxygenase QhpG n=1 Tax=Paracoccus sp. DMF TaxID=400837 RepID=UPI0021E4EF3F|nr:pilus assembly protein CpaD [Paracoccus sp. DMF]MCV2448160.1 pilus assembly protein CpaD [Paracoccus sp. DMF]
MAHDADLIVLGGGPAGAISAWLAARDGLRVLLVDPGRSRPRPEGLSPRLHRWLDGQGLLAGFHGILGPLRRQVDWAGISEGNSERVVERAALDAHLRGCAQAAGARLVAGNGRPEPGGVALSAGRLRAPLVIDARGRAAPAGLGKAPATLALSGWARADLPPGIRLAAHAGGWLWRVALPDGRVWVQALMDAAGQDGSGSRGPGQRLSAAMAAAEPALAGAPLIGPVLAREAAPRLPRPLGDLSLLPVGDALAAMDPLSGHGQFWAVSSALAVAAVRRTLDARPGDDALCRRFLMRRAHETSLHQARVGRDFLRAEPRFRDQPFWRARLDFPDDLPASDAPSRPEIAAAVVVENGLLAEREVLRTAAAPQGIGWFGTIPAAEAFRLWQAQGPAGLVARWGAAGEAVARQIAAG